METILTVKEESMIAVADAVREKSGTSGALSFPNGMVDAINSIETTVMSVQVDNQTIIEKDGVIRTAIGGYRTEPLPGEDLYLFNGEETGEYISLTHDETELSSGYFRGYYVIPNWTPLGEQYVGRQLEIRVKEYPQYPDTNSWIEPYTTDGWFDGTTISLNACGETVDSMIDNATGYLRAVDHVFDMSDQYPDPRVGLIIIRARETYGDYIPIDARFVNVDNQTIINDDGVLNANPLRDRVDDLQWQIDEIRNNGGGGGSSDAASITFDDTAAQIGVDNIQAAIEYLADEAASSTSVQLQIDENDISLAKDLQRYEATRVYWYRGAVNASDFDWSNKICPQLTYHQGVIYWDLEETNLLGVYANNYLVFSKQSGLEYIMKKGHYYQFRELQWDYFKAFCDKYGREGNTEYYFGVQNDLPVIYSPVSTNIFALYYDNMKCYVFTDVTYVYADAAITEDRVNELINEALGVIENGTY